MCRRSYIHPGILAAAESGELRRLLQEHSVADDPPREFTADEARLAALLPGLDD